MVLCPSPPFGVHSCGSFRAGPLGKQVLSTCMVLSWPVYSSGTVLFSLSVCPSFLPVCVRLSACLLFLRLSPNTKDVQAILCISFYVA